MLSVDSPGSSANSQVFRFAGVELDAGRLQLRVDGRSVTCPPKAFELLALLCRSPQAVLTRSELMDALWPGGQVISVEALTQAIFRARGALGAYAGLLVTVRGIGLRLDARVMAPEPRGPATLTAVAPAAAPTAATAGKHRPGRWLLVAAVAIVATALAAWFRPAPSMPEMLDVGYGLTAEDILAEQPETAAMVVDALESDAIGERGRGASLLEAVHRSDAGTPVPALFLALWSSGQGEREASAAWLEQARARMGAHRDLYLNLLLDHVAASIEGDAEDIIHTAGALLDLRPEAWRMHHARSHLFEYSGMREAALREISQIQVNDLHSRKLALVIADRASMGDVTGAQAMLDRIPGDDEPAMYAFLNGRVAWSRGDFDAAREHFLAAAEVGHEFARRDILRQSLIYAGAIEAMHGQDDQALRTLDRARGLAVGHSEIDEIDLSLSIAQLNEAAGRTAETDAALGRALALTTGKETGGVELQAQLTAMRLRPGTPRPRPDPLPPEAEALWQAVDRATNGDVALARLALVEAINRGVLETRLADEARWLEWQLGMPVSPETVIDPPYPPLSRVVLRREIRRQLAARGEYAGPDRP